MPRASLTVATLQDLDNLPQAEALMRSHLPSSLSENECWAWNGHTEMGYGRIQVRSHGKWVKVFSYRLSFLLFYGYLPQPPMLVRHKVCGNRLCCNPMHLEEGTGKDDAADRERHGHTLRGATHPRHISPEKWKNIVRGEKVHGAKANPSMVREIRRLRKQGLLLRVLAQMTGLSVRTIGLIVRRDTWAHVPDE